MTVEDEIARWRERQDAKRRSAGVPDEMRDDFAPAVRDAAMAAHAASIRLGMLRVGNPWSPIAAAIERSAGTNDPRGSMISSAHAGALLKERVDEAGGQARFAKLACVSPQYVCDCLKGRRDIGKGIARALGYEPVTMYRPIR